MEVFDQYSALLALGMPPCLPKPRDANVDAPAGWHWSGLADLPAEVARRTLESFALEWFIGEFGFCSVVRMGGQVQLLSIRRKGSMPVPSPRRERKKRLGELLIERGLLNEDQLEHALRQCRGTGARLGETILSNGLLTPDVLLPVLAEQMGVPYVPPDVLALPGRLINSFGVSRRFNVVIFAEDAHTVHVATVDPQDDILRDTLASLSGKQVVLALADRSSIVGAIEMLQSLSIAEHDSVPVPVLKYVDATILEAVKQGASAVRFAPTSKEVIAEFEFGELIGHATAPPRRLHEAVVRRLKRICGLGTHQVADIVESEAAYTVGDQSVLLVLQVTPGPDGEAVRLRISATEESQSEAVPTNLDAAVPVEVQAKTLLMAIIKAVRAIRGDSDEGTGIHAKISV